MKRIARINLAVVPAVLTALLAHLACPACWPLFAAALSWMGLSFLLSEKYLPPLTAICLALALIALGYTAVKQRRYGPSAARDGGGGADRRRVIRARQIDRNNVRRAGADCVIRLEQSA